MVIYEGYGPRYVDITYMSLNHIDMVNINSWLLYIYVQARNSLA